VAPTETGSAFVAERSGRVRDILCIQAERRVGNDNTVKWRALTLQIPLSPLRRHLVRAMLRVHEYPDGQMATFTGHIGWPITIPRESCATARNWLREPLR